MRYPEIYPPEEDDYHLVASGRTMFLDAIDHSVAETIVEYLQASSAQMTVAQIRVLGGAMARVPAEATAFGHRGAGAETWFIGASGAEPVDPVRNWVRRAFDRTAPFATGGTYVNALAGEQSIADAYGAGILVRLIEAKRRYDPDGVFSGNGIV